MADSAGVAYLRTFPDFEQGNVSAAQTFGLDRVLALLHEVGSPHMRLRVFHVAGTKGKGSTAAAIAAIASAAGYRTGMFTQPHLIRLNERFTIDGIEIEDDTLTAVALDCIRPAVERLAERGQAGIQHFEVQVALAMLWFEAQNVDLTVLEVGLGGRLDATNVVPSPLVTTLTSIGYDHMAVLGHSLTEIAGEKAAIVKPGVPAVASPQTREAEAVIVARCRAVGAPLLLGGRDWQVRNIITSLAGTTFDLDLDAAVLADARGERRPVAEGQRFELKGLHTPLLGAHQAVNAGAAAVTVLTAAGILPRLDGATVRRGLASVFWPGRLQIVAELPTVVVDGAHTPESATVLAEAIGTLFPGVKPILVCGVQADKDIPGVAAPLAAIASLVIATRARHRRAAPTELLAAAFIGAGAALVEQVEVAADALARARRCAALDSLILVTGSLYLVGEVLAELHVQASRGGKP